MTSDRIVLASMAIYALAVFTAVVIRHRLALREWQRTWRARMTDRREAMRADWLASEGLTNA